MRCELPTAPVRARQWPAGGAAAGREGETALTNIFFHIGMHKTATTWFQQRFFPKLEGVRVLHTRHVAKVPIPSPDAPTLIVSHAGVERKAVGQEDARHQQLNGWRTISGQFNSVLLTAASSSDFGSNVAGFTRPIATKQRKPGALASKAMLQPFPSRTCHGVKPSGPLNGSSPGVFPFLYEELLLQPHVLIKDLCSFIGKTPPKNLDQLLTARENPSPRSHVGQLVAQSLYALHYASGRMISQKLFWPDRRPVRPLLPDQADGP